MMDDRVQPSDLELAALISSKICHDLIGPVGNINNGLEILDEEDDAQSRNYALDVIRNVTETASARLHPLVHRNESDLEAQRFVTAFTGDEFFLRDHVVQGAKVLPGVCYLEMARAAVERSAGRGRRVGVLTDVVWARPLRVAGRCEVELAVYPAAADAADFAVYCGDRETGLHAQGRAVWRDDALAPVLPLELAALRAGCAEELSPAACYATFEAMGLVYGEAHRGLAWVGRGRDAAGARYVLAQVRLADRVSATVPDYVLHPGLLDSALQASVGLWGEGDAARAALPFALERLEVWSPISAEAWVQVREVSEPGSGVQKLDAVVCDASGAVCVRLGGLVLRSLEPAVPAKPQV